MYMSVQGTVLLPLVDCEQRITSSRRSCTSASFGGFAHRTCCHEIGVVEMERGWELERRHVVNEVLESWFSVIQRCIDIGWPVQVQL